MKKKNIAILVSVIVVAVVVILLLLFNLKTYGVMYNTNGGSFVATENVKVFMKAKRPADPVKEGFTFDNWYYNDGIFDFDTRITQDMIIEARWIEGNPVAGTYVVSFNSNGGSSIASIRSNEDGTVNQPADPVREGYKFVAWQYNGKDFDFGTKIKSNMTLVAKWEEDDGSGNGESVPAEKVTLSPTTLSLTVGNTRRISVTLSPKEAVNRTMKWSTSNNRIATVDANGTVRAVGAGKATITVEVDGIKASITVTVTKASGGNQGNVTPIDPNPGTDTPTPPEPEQPETYSIVYEEISSSAMGEVYIKIKGSKRGFVGGIIQMTMQNGTVVNETITAAGLKMPRQVIQNVTVVSAN